jgi:hypothetical protein
MKREQKRNKRKALAGQGFSFTVKKQKLSLND